MRKLLLALLVPLIAALGTAQVTPNGYVTATSLTEGQSTTFVRQGSTPAGFAWSEATLWHPAGGHTVLGQVQQNPYSQSITPSGGYGTYWIQFRLVDANIAFADQWISFKVNPPAPTPQASVTPEIVDGQSVTLTRAGQTPGGFGWTESVIWQPNGQPVVIPDQGLGNYSYTPTGGPGVYWYQFRLVNAYQGYTDQWIPFSVNMRFQILVSTNQLNNNEAAQAATFAADGVLSMPYNSLFAYFDSPNNQYPNPYAANPIIPSTSFPALMSTLNAGQWTISEDLYGDWGITGLTEAFIDRPVDAQIVYLETSTPGYNPAPDTVATVAQIDAAHAATGNPILVLSRSYADQRAGYVNQALDHGPCSGVVFETNPEAYPGVMWHQNFNAGIAHAIGTKGKKCYLLLPPKAGSTNYLADVKAAMAYFAQSGYLNHPNLYIVLAAYVRGDTKTGFLTGDNALGYQHSVKAAVEWLKEYRAGRATLP